MNNVKAYKIFPNKTDCVVFLEILRWNSTAKCPYCMSPKCSKISSEDRYHCTNCNSSFSVTVGTIFHNSKLDLQKWFQIIYLLIDKKFDISARKISRLVNINKDTSCRIKQVVSEAMYNPEERETILRIHDKLNSIYNE
ncbi:transposase [Gracilimonas sp.]|uniref:transposase n=1 Tax=Gracilimonas sp. TaxID=1974203 RepID=UPI0037535257